MDFYLFAVVVLFVLATFDLMVGVSNDAVNFLNSAVGSRVASRTTILVVVSLGILLGSTFSSGMMEIARKGIFSPQHFSLADVMVIFLAVMIADVILLDMFNTFGMPTSTTVSIVFELFGAAVAMALWKILAGGAAAGSLADYINSEKALAIIFGILLSVVVAFVAGVSIQYLSRLLFSFQYEQRFRWFGAVWCGLALASMVYFLLIKGLKGASFVSPQLVGWAATRAALLFPALVVTFAAAAQLLMWLGFRVLRGVVLFGTFALAMAFAGNDLVNFIGVPVAGVESYRLWLRTQVPADLYTMEALLEPVRTNSWLLLAAGAVMVVTLWFSKKARTVTETEVNLARQSAGFERFAPNPLSRMIVSLSLDAGRLVVALVPDAWHRRMELSFRKPARIEDRPGRPAFDLIRASVNLTAASILIALATSWKLPLSTTYVSFMVAMGTSLADRAWDRESAVYRVSGVINVIGGWFLTAAAAFLMAALFATMIHFLGAVGVVILLVLAAIAIWRSVHVHAHLEGNRLERLRLTQRSYLAVHTALDETTQGTAEVLQAICRAYHTALEGLIHEERMNLRQARREMRQAKKRIEAVRVNLHHFIASLDEPRAEGSHAYLKFFDMSHDILQSLDSALHACDDHVRNCHSPPAPPQVAMLTDVRQQVEAYLQMVSQRTRAKEFADISSAVAEKKRLLKLLEELFERHVGQVKDHAVGARNTEVILRLLLDSKDLVAIGARFLKFYHRRLDVPQAPSEAVPAAD